MGRSALGSLVAPARGVLELWQLLAPPQAVAVGGALHRQLPLGLRLARAESERLRLGSLELLRPVAVVPRPVIIIVLPITAVSRLSPSSL